MASGFTVAGVYTLTTLIDNFIKNKKNVFDDHFTRSDISDFFGLACNKFLHSYGLNFKNKKKYNKYNKNESQVLKNLKNSGFYEKSKLIVDSGGFQISIGLLDKRESEILFDIYHGFLTDYRDVYDQAFVLDIPPGPGCQVFTDFDQIYRMNTESYKTAANLPDEVRQKMIYIHHFRTPMLWDIYNKILKKNDMYQYFDYFGTGGIVANSSGDSGIPCIMYVLPLVTLLNETIRHKRTYLNFHILGGATTRDIMFYALFKKHVKEIHNIDLNITYDSSGLFKALMVGRYIYMIDEDTIRKLDIRSSNLEMWFKDNFKTSDACKEVMNNVARKYNFKELQFDSLYNDDTGTFLEPVKIYLMLYMLEFYTEVENLAEKETERMYPMYKNGLTEEFNVEIEQITRNFNQGRISKKQTSKANSVTRSLDMLTNLDEDYCKYIVNRFLAKDEFTELTEGGSFLKI